MEPNESSHHLSSYFATTTTTPSPTNGLMPPHPNSTSDSGGGPHMLYPHSVGPSSAAVATAPVEPPRRKRGRPRKYGTPEQALAAKKTASSSNSVPKEKREGATSYSGSSRKSQQLFALGSPCSYCYCSVIFLLWCCWFAPEFTSFFAFSCNSYSSLSYLSLEKKKKKTFVVHFVHLIASAQGF